MKPLISSRRIRIFHEGLDHPEGVAIHPDGSVWAGGEAGQIYKISPDGGEREEVANTGGFILGLAFSPDASWLAVCDIKNLCVWKLHLKSKKLSRFAERAGKHRFQTPNYMAFTPDGNLFVSDSGDPHKATGKILRLNPSGSGEIWHGGPFRFANGVALSPRGDALFVACSFLPGVEKIEIKSDDTAGRRSIYCKLPKTCPDGLAFDAKCNLYVSCYTPARIYRIDPKRNIRVLVEDWQSHLLSNPTNMAFGGKGNRQLYVSNLGRWHISCLQMNVSGAAVPLIQSLAACRT